MGLGSLLVSASINYDKVLSSHKASLECQLSLSICMGKLTEKPHHLKEILDKHCSNPSLNPCLERRRHRPVEIVGSIYASRTPSVN